jgi:glycine/D-amino acid oxidase-like deaminating enzyme
MPDKADVVICGAGIAGVATAYFLAEKMGVRDVVLVDKRGPLTLTSDKSTECYRDWWPDPLMVKFMSHTVDLLEDLARDNDNAFHMNRRGYAYITTREEGAAEMRRSAEHHAGLGLGPLRVHEGTGGGSDAYRPPAPEGFEGAPGGVDLLLDQAVIQSAYPYLGTDVQAVLHPRRCGWFSAQQMGMLLLEKAKSLGMREIRGEVVGIERDARGVCGIRVAGDSGVGTIETRRFVSAAGPFAGNVGQMLGIEVPVKNILHQKIAIRDNLDVVGRDAPLLILNDPIKLDWSDEEAAMWAADSEYSWLLEQFPAGLHIRPEGGEDSPWILILWGFEATAQEPAWEPQFTPEFPEMVLRGAVKLVPGLAQYVGRIPKPMMHDGGYYTKTQENLPLVGPLGVEGAFMVGALSGYGVMAACAAGELGALWVTDSGLPDYADALALQRYDDPAYVASLEHRGPTGEI